MLVSDDVAKHAFTSVKNVITDAPALSSFKLGARCLVTVDASQKGIGTVLSQSQVIKCITQGWPKERCLPSPMKPFSQVSNELSIVNGLLFQNDLVVPPISIRSKNVQVAHSGQLGVGATSKNIKQYFWWPSIDSQIAAWISSCSTCLLSGKHWLTHKTPLHTVPLPEPWLLWIFQVLFTCYHMIRDF